MTFLSPQEREELERLITHYRTLLESHAASPFDLHNLALAYYRKGDFEQAYRRSVQSLEIEKPGERARTLQLQGLIFRAVGELERAAEAFSLALHDGGPLPEVLFERAVTHHQLDNLPAAEADFEHSLELEKSLSCYYNLGVIYVLRKKWTQAVECFASCLALDPFGRDDYIALLVQCGRAEARQEVYAQGHRMKNLLGVLGNELRGLERDLAPQLTASGSERIDQLRGRLERIYQDMVQYLKILQQDGDPPDLVDVNEIVAKVLFLASGSLRGIELKTQLAEDLPGIVAPPNQVSEILLNILINAIEALDGRPDAQIQVSSAAEGELVCVEIVDNGPGLPADVQRLFELGYTTKEFGSGIGLAHAHNLVQALGGTINAGHRPGGGAHFRVVLPLASDGGAGLEGLAIRGRFAEDLKELLIRNDPPPKLEPEDPKGDSHGRV